LAGFAFLSSSLSAAILRIPAASAVLYSFPVFANVASAQFARP
jgi:hypothetical protein